MHDEWVCFTYMDGTCMQFQWIWPSPGMDRCSLFVTMPKIYNVSSFGKLPPQSATVHTEKEMKEKEKKVIRCEEKKITLKK